jgi:hypothetical protein
MTRQDDDNTEYLITRRMALEIAMMEDDGEPSRKIRRYLIACEVVMRQGAPDASRAAEINRALLDFHAVPRELASLLRLDRGLTLPIYRNPAVVAEFERLLLREAEADPELARLLSKRRTLAVALREFP